jgi:hypothetical protein
VHEPLEGIAQADALLGRAFPLPSAPLPLTRWSDVAQLGEHGAELVWSLDDSRPAAPGRLALYAGLEPPPPRDLDAAAPESREGFEWRRAALEHAQESLRPVVELRWRRADVHLRLTAQGPWDEQALLAIARSV